MDSLKKTHDLSIGGCFLDMLNPSPESRASNHNLSNQPENVLSSSMPKIFAELRISERYFSSFRREEWDNFALACGGSFLGSCRAVRPLGLPMGSVQENLNDYVKHGEWFRSFAVSI